MADTELTPQRRARIAELVRDHGLTPAEADLVDAMEAGEASGDIVVIGDPDDASPPAEDVPTPRPPEPDRDASGGRQS